MSIHRYPCPNCAAVLQAPRDVTGLPVRCLGCNAVFTAGAKAAPESVRPTPQPTRRSRPTRPERYPSLPEIPRRSGLRGILVIAVLLGALGAAGGLTFAIVRAKGTKAGTDGKVVQAPEREPPAAPKPGLAKGESQKPSPAPRSTRVEEEEEGPAGPRTPALPKPELEKPKDPGFPDPVLPPIKPEGPPPRRTEVEEAPVTPAPKPAEPVRPAPKDPPAEPAARVGKIEPRVRQTDRTVAVVDIRAELADPFQKITKVAVLYVRADGTPEQPMPGRDGSWTALPRAMRAELKLERVAAVGTIRLAANDVGNVPMIFQAEWTLADGKKVYGEPMVHAWPDPRNTDPSLPTPPPQPKSGPIPAPAPAPPPTGSAGGPPPPSGGPAPSSGGPPPGSSKGPPGKK